MNDLNYEQLNLWTATSGTGWVQVNFLERRTQKKCEM
jgi:hypothetical protein